jgi:hypothetical protein
MEYFATFPYEIHKQNIHEGYNLGSHLEIMIVNVKETSNLQGAL